ncbi:type II secretion system F family protein [Paenibacillus hexagrammi]|uniref:Type II secretion system F family protein n=1 Tax=Paenibacillus hexagrammi TaxID=2908839 RepID=A0ABY3SH54_9BACL|nr:type II secretion system F family protein [Paenibacillus sp. YPD9-1]UJF32833.1 type II secretion system F family protein [Paenibacillus sp. YPD9-1]
MVYVTFFFTVTLLVYAPFIWKQDRRKHMQRRISWITEKEDTAEPQQQEIKTKRRLLQRLLLFLWKELKRGFGRRMPGQKEAKLELRLMQAGHPFGLTPVDFRIAEIALLLLLPCLAGLYAGLIRLGPGGIFAFAGVGLVIAFVLPQFYLGLKIKQRSRQALRELPDVLDLLTVSLEAGLGFDSALSKLISKKEGVVTSEFQRCLEEIRLGKTRREALQSVRERLELDEMKVLISSILQAEKLGIGMVQVLRVQSHEVREQRKQRAEEAAMKAPIKMLFPLVLFIFPSLFIVLLGPALIQFIQTFSK